MRFLDRQTFKIALLVVSICSNVVLVCAILQARHPVSPIPQRSIALPVQPDSHTIERLADLPLADAVRAMRDRGMSAAVVRSYVRDAAMRPAFLLEKSLLAKQADVGWPDALLRSNKLKQVLSSNDMNRLSVEQSRARYLILSLVGPEGLDVDGRIASRFPGLSFERAVIAGLIDTDYAEIRNSLVRRHQLISLATDQSELSNLENERQRDLDAVLTADERVNAAKLLPGWISDTRRRAIAAFSPSDREFLQIAASERTRGFDSEASDSLQLDSSDQNRSEAWDMAQRPDYQKLVLRYKIDTLTATTFSTLLDELSKSTRARETSQAEISKQAEATALYLQTRAGSQADGIIKAIAPWLISLQEGEKIRVSHSRSVTRHGGAPMVLPQGRMVLRTREPFVWKRNEE